MPRHLAPPLLGAIAARAAAKLLLRGCQTLDRRSVGQLFNEVLAKCVDCFELSPRWEEPEEPPCLSPPRPPGSPPRPVLPRDQVIHRQIGNFFLRFCDLCFWQVGAILPPEQRPLLLWLRNLPDPVVEQVFTSFLNLHLGILPELPSQTLTC